MDKEQDEDPQVHPDYQPPSVSYLGDLSTLTKDKTVGAADGSTFLGLDIGIS